MADRLQMAQYQRDHRPVAALADGQLDLRQAVALVHAGDQAAQRHQHRADHRRQHRADLHVGHIAALALMKANQHRTFLEYMTHRKPGAVPVTPSRAFDRAKDVVGYDFAQMPEVVLQHALLHRHLRTDMKVLHLATTTSPGVKPKMGTAGLDALG